MKRVMHAAIVSVIAAPVLVIGQGSDVARVLADVRRALGGEEKLAAVRTLSVEGTNTRSLADGTSRGSQFEMAFELPDKFMKKEAIGMINGASISRTSGFNGEAVIDATDMPPQFGGGMHRIVTQAGGATAGGAPPTPERQQQLRHAALQTSRREFARLALGMLGTAVAAYPLEFTYAGQAESPDGKADVLEVRHTDGFTAKIFIDATTRLPLMLSWMDKEPLVMTPVSMSREGVQGSGGGTQIIRGGAGGSMSREDMDRLMQEQQERIKEAEARRQVVEYRMFYADYKAVDGIKVPTRIQRMIAGQPTDELALERIKVNPRLDARTFAPTPSESR